MSGLDLTTDVLVVGGGPAATWAALKAAQDGADVVLADKGYCGTSGATASAGTGVWYVPPEPTAREAAMASREALGGFLADRRWMTRVLDQTYAGMNELAAAGRYPFPTGPDGHQLRNGLQGPEYMRRMRIRVQRAGARILDHSPVTELLTDPSGAVPYEKNYLRHGDRLTASLEVLDSVWEESRASLHAGDGDTVRARQAAAMAAHARWMYASALARTETRGMAKRLDFPASDPRQHHRIVTGGLDQVWTRTEPLTTAPTASTAPAAPLEVAS